MANYREKIAFLRDYIANKDDYLPLIDHAWKTFGKRNAIEGNIFLAKQTTALRTYHKDFH